MTQTYFLHSRDDETGKQNLVVFVPGGGMETADSDSHANFQEILDAVRNDEPVEDILELFDMAQAVAKRFEPLTDRITVANGQVYLDGDLVENALTKQIVRFLEEDVPDWVPLVDFFDNVLSNPESHSREQLYEWLERHDFTIDTGGYILAYKGVDADMKSTRSGPGIVNGEEVNERLDNSVGNIVEIPRSLVHHDPSQGCSSGLHVGTFEYASTFAAVTLKVRVNPRDIVSVPTDCNAQKVRCCRYEVLEVIEQKIQSAYQASEVDDDWGYDEDDYDEEEACDCEVCVQAAYDPGYF